MGYVPGALVEVAVVVKPAVPLITPLLSPLAKPLKLAVKVGLAIPYVRFVSSAVTVRLFLVTVKL